MYDDGFCFEYRSDDNNAWLFRSPEGLATRKEKVVRFDNAPSKVFAEQPYTTDGSLAQ
jgi:hypothetical protein